MEKLYIMCGLAFSGKSTLSKRIADQVGGRRFAFDEMWVKTAEKELIPEGAEGWRFVRDAAQREILECLQRGVSAVYDENNPRREHREEFIKLAERAGAEAVVVYMDTPFDIIRQRRQANLSSQERHDVDDTNFEKVLSDLEVPTPDENVLFFTPETDMDDFLAKLS